MKITKADGKAEYELLAAMRARGGAVGETVGADVSRIIGEVKSRGDAALKEYTEKFDGARRESIAVSGREIEDACAVVSPEFLRSLERAAANIRDFHQRQLSQSWFVTKPDGVIMGQRVRGLNRVGVYVPGGKAAYPSSVLMNAIPASVAGVKEIVMATPPGRDGKVSANILAAAKLAGVSKIFAVGGAQAVAALAYGTQTVPKVDKIVGPGNIYVATAKRLVFGAVDIDMIAGPSEILVIADDSANPRFLAADLMSQAEHDEMASAVLVTTSEAVARETMKEISRQSENLSRKQVIGRSLESYGAAVVVSDIDKAVEFANEVAPEHLELMVRNPAELLGRVNNAGSVFLGRYAPEPLGDYFAGPNHVLPTGGTARFFSPLSVDAFLKKMSFISYTRTALEKSKDDIVTLAESEGLTAHANSIRVRFEKEAGGAL